MKQTTLRVYIRRLVLSAMFLAIGLVLPFVTGQIPQVGSMLLPMHIPVLLCGLICGWGCGGLVGFVMPLLRSALFGMPPMFPTAVAMAFELAAYGILAGWFYDRAKWKCVVSLYRSLIAAMIGGRVVWGGAMVVLLGLGSEGFTWAMFLSGAFLTAIPGIVLQLVVIPGVMVTLGKAKLVSFHRERASEKQHM